MPRRHVRARFSLPRRPLGARLPNLSSVTGWRLAERATSVGGPRMPFHAQLGHARASTGRLKQKSLMNPATAGYSAWPRDWMRERTLRPTVPIETSGPGRESDREPFGFEKTWRRDGEPSDGRPRSTLGKGNGATAGLVNGPANPIMARHRNCWGNNA